MLAKKEDYNSSSSHYQYQLDRMSNNNNIKRISRRRKSSEITIYRYIEINMSIKDPKTMLIHYKRRYEIQSISDKPIYNVQHQIATDVEKTFDDLNIRVYDEHNQALKISNISIDKPYQKEFTTRFNKPIMKGGKSRYYSMEYDVEEPENALNTHF
jgi:hypothetical protein